VRLGDSVSQNFLLSKKLLKRLNILVAAPQRNFCREGFMPANCAISLIRKEKKKKKKKTAQKRFGAAFYKPHYATSFFVATKSRFGSICLGSHRI